MDCFFWTTGLTLPAADTVKAVRIFINFNIKFADFLTGTAFCTLIRINFVTVKTYFIEQAVNCTERTDITAERSVNYNGRNYCYDKN